MQLNARQKKIVELVKMYEPITSDEIAQRLAVGKSTLRNELSVLVMVGVLSAKPNVGYYYNESFSSVSNRKLFDDVKVKDVMGVAITAKNTEPFSDVVTKLYVHDIGTVFIVNEENHLVGVVSRKDMLKMAISNHNVSAVPIALAMTRIPNVVFCQEDEYFVDGLKRLITHQVDCLPVVQKDGEHYIVVGRISKTISIGLMLDLLEESSC
ncbi:CBS domain-containing protein [Granulicatella sp. zg-ZJ]|uniref:CBS domain-containing protein n=1 Tax=Granulicatella sp. zg-ZJ TaxID=2678504 RepID=UPI0013CF6B86|nr:CBS domain-containing protein [Granulicatella sp. zg-ZJ]MBS4749732.1 CBS domain-containing protein [Carnobacteriaceae bacterium zg-ZUI78]NEW63228.1 CBS domain-containing protein [Granulicatella sp. zg-ZJ]